MHQNAAQARHPVWRFKNIKGIRGGVLSVATYSIVCPMPFQTGSAFQLWSLCHMRHAAFTPAGWSSCFEASRKRASPSTVIGNRLASQWLVHGWRHATFLFVVLVIWGCVFSRTFRYRCLIEFNSVECWCVFQNEFTNRSKILGCSKRLSPWSHGLADPTNFYECVL